jgi:uncharacterized repeat protein (TIGR01451 family)
MFRALTSNIGVEKWAEGNGQAYPGGPVVYGLRVRNRGLGTASQVVIFDTLPDNTTYSGDSSGVEPTRIGNQLVWDLGALASGAEVSFYLYLQNSASAGESLRNEATAWAPYDEDPDNNRSQAEVQVVEGLPDLYVIKRTETADPAAGETMLWHISPGNAGPVAAGPILLTDTLPTGTALLEWWSDAEYDWSEVARDGQLVLRAPATPGGWADTLHVRLALDPELETGTTLTNTVEISTAVDANPADNRQQHTVSVGPRRWNAAVYKEFARGILVPGGEIEYDVQVRNQGNVSATVTLTDLLPQGTSFAEAWRWDRLERLPFPPGVVDDTAAVWDLGPMQAGDEMNLTVRFDIGEDTPVGTILENCARVAAPRDEWSLDDRACRVDRVNAPGPNLVVEKKRGWGSPNRIDYQVHLRNVGTTDLPGLFVTDTLPSDTTFAGNWSHWFWGAVELAHESSTQLAWALGELESGRSTGLTFPVDLDADVGGVPGRAFTNTVTSPVAGDAFPSDNTSTVVSYSGPELYISKKHTAGEPEPGEVITFTVRFGNLASHMTSGSVRITDTLPAGMWFVRATSPWHADETWPPDSHTGNTVVLGFGRLPAESDWSIDLAVQIDEGATIGDVLVNRIEIASADPVQDAEFNRANNAVQVSVPVAAPVDLFLPMIERGP